MNAISKQEEILTLPTKPSLSLCDISPKGEDKGEGAAVTAMITQMAQTMNQMQLVVASMAEMISATNRNVDDLRRQVQRMDKATPAQVGAIREAIRQRAAELCAAYGCEGCEKKVAAAIRKSIRIGRVHITRKENQFRAPALSDHVTGFHIAQFINR